MAATHATPTALPWCACERCSFCIGAGLLLLLLLLALRIG
jgi:hypothetical protein